MGNSSGDRLSPSTRADLKAALARLGATLDPAASVSYVKRPTGPTAIVVLERVRAGYEPEYCLHGYTECVGCDQVCYLGHESVKVVSEQRAAAMCLECSNRLADEGKLDESMNIGNVNDHLRKDGPH